MPLELGQVLECPDIISPPCSLFPSNRLSIQHSRDRSSDFFVFEFNPPFGIVWFLSGSVFATQISTFSICKGISFRCGRGCISTYPLFVNKPVPLPRTVHEMPHFGRLHA